MALQPIRNMPFPSEERVVHFPVQEGGKSYLNPKSSYEVVALFSRTYVFDPLPNDLMLPPVRLSKADFLRALETFNERAAERNFPPIKIVKMLFIGSKALGTICPELQKARADTDIVFLCEFDSDQMEEQKLWFSLIMGEVIYDAILKEKNSSERIDSHWKGGGNVRKALQNQASFSRYYCRRTGFGDLYQPTPKSGVTYTFDSLLDCTVLYNPLWDGEDLLGFAIDITDFIRSGVEKFPFSMSEEQLAHATRCLKERHFERARNEKGMRQLFKLLQEMGRGLKSIDAQTQQLTEKAFLEECHKGNFENEVNHFLKVHFENDEKGKQLFLIHLQQFLRRKEIDISHPLFLPPHVIDLWALSLIVDHPNDSMLCLYSNQKEGIGTLYRPLFQTKFLLERLLDFEGQEEIEKLNSLFGLPPKAETLFQRALQKVVREASSFPPPLIERFIYHPQTGVRERIQLILSSRDEEEIARWSRDLEIPDQKSLSEALSTLFFNAFEEESGRLSFSLFSTLRQQWGSRPLSRHHQRRYRDFLHALPPEKLVEISDFIWWDFEILQDPDSLLLCATLAELSPDSFFAHPLSPQWQERFLKDPKGIISFAHALTKGSVHIRKMISFFHEIQINGLSIHEGFHAHFIRVLPSLYQNASHEDLFTLVRLYCEITKRMPEELEGFEAYLDEYIKKGNPVRTMVSHLLSPRAPHLSEWILKLHFGNSSQQRLELIKQWWSTGLPVYQAFILMHYDKANAIELIETFFSTHPEETILGWLEFLIRYKQLEKEVIEREWPLIEKKIASLPTAERRISLIIKMKELLYPSLGARYLISSLEDQNELIIIEGLLTLFLDRANISATKDQVYDFFNESQKVISFFSTDKKISVVDLYKKLFSTYPELKERELALRYDLLLSLFQGHAPQFNTAIAILRKGLCIYKEDVFFFDQLVEAYSLSCLTHLFPHNIKQMERECANLAKALDNRRALKSEVVKIEAFVKQLNEEIASLVKELKKNANVQRKELLTTKLKERDQNKEKLQKSIAFVKEIDFIQNQIEAREEAINSYNSKLAHYIGMISLWLTTKEIDDSFSFEKYEKLFGYLAQLSPIIVQSSSHANQYSIDFLIPLAIKLRGQLNKEWDFCLTRVFLPFIAALSLEPSTKKRFLYREIKSFAFTLYLYTTPLGQVVALPVDRRVQEAQKQSFIEYINLSGQPNLQHLLKFTLHLLEVEIHPELRLLSQEDFEEIMYALISAVEEENYEATVVNKFTILMIGKLLDAKAQVELAEYWRANALYQNFLNDDTIPEEIRALSDSPFSSSDLQILFRWIEGQPAEPKLLKRVSLCLRISSYYCDTDPLIRSFLISNIYRGTKEALFSVATGAQVLVTNNLESWSQIDAINQTLLDCLLSDDPKLPPLKERLRCATELVAGNSMISKMNPQEALKKFASFNPIMDAYFKALSTNELSIQDFFPEIHYFLEWSLKTQAHFSNELGVACYRWMNQNLILPFFSKFTHYAPKCMSIRQTPSIWFGMIIIFEEISSKLQILEQDNRELVAEIQRQREEIHKCFNKAFFSYKSGKEPSFWPLQMDTFADYLQSIIPMFSPSTTYGQTTPLWLLSHLLRCKENKKLSASLEKMQNCINLLQLNILGEKKSSSEVKSETKELGSSSRKKKKKRGP